MTDSLKLIVQTTNSCLFESFLFETFSLNISLSLNRNSIRDVPSCTRKTNISYPLMRAHTCACKGVENVSFSENSAYILNG